MRGEGRGEVGRRICRREQGKGGGRGRGWQGEEEETTVFRRVPLLSLLRTRESHQCHVPRAVDDLSAARLLWSRGSGLLRGWSGSLITGEARRQQQQRRRLRARRQLARMDIRWHNCKSSRGNSRDGIAIEQPHVGGERVDGGLIVGTIARVLSSLQLALDRRQIHGLTDKLRVAGRDLIGDWLRKPAIHIEFERNSTARVQRSCRDSAASRRSAACVEGAVLPLPPAEAGAASGVPNFGVLPLARLAAGFDSSSESGAHTSFSEGSRKDLAAEARRSR